MQFFAIFIVYIGYKASFHLPFLQFASFWILSYSAGLFACAKKPVAYSIFLFACVEKLFACVEILFTCSRSAKDFIQKIQRFID